MRVPHQETLHVQASCSLPEIGGHCTDKVRDFQYKDFLRFDEAHTEVTGAESEGNYCTLIQSTVTGLNINQIVQVDRIVARIYSIYKDSPDGEPAIKLIGSTYENLRIAGVPVTVDLAVDVFDRLDKHHKLVEAVGVDDKLRELLGKVTLRDRFDAVDERIRRWFRRPPAECKQLPANKGFTEVSLVRHIDAPGLHVEGNAIYVAGFGVIRLATLQIAQYTRRLFMLQAHLGCAFEGDLTACEIQDGGVDW